jgi:heme/copper-type cytochrome/quinol oxidase subunit 4
MRISSPVKMILLGLFLSIMGVVLPFLMVMKILTSSFTLNFLSYAAMVAGLFLGITGAAMYVRLNKTK